MSTLVRTWRLWSVLLLLLAAGALAARAQDAPSPEAPEAPEVPPIAEPTASTPAAEESSLGDDRLGRWQLDLEQWVAQPSGLDYVPVIVVNPNDPGTSVQLGTRHGTQGDTRVHLAYAFRDDIGTFSLSFWSTSDRSRFSQYNPGVFVLGEVLVPAQFGGTFDDGTADALDATAETKTRDLRLDFSRQAFTTRRVSARWFFGLRQVDHDRTFGARYHGLAANLPLVVENNAVREDLLPLADIASVSSSFSGRGPEFGLEVEIPLGKRFRISSGLAAAVLRGDISTRYSSLSRIYAAVAGNEVVGVIGPEIRDYLLEWNATEPSERTDSPLQVTIPIGLVNESRSASAQVLDASLAVRYRVWRELEIYGGARTSRYTDVASDVRPILTEVALLGRVPGSAPGVTGPVLTVPVAGVQEAPRSVDYEGYFLGLAYRY